MTVKQVIEELQKYPGETLVFIANPENASELIGGFQYSDKGYEACMDLATYEGQPELTNTTKVLKLA